MKKIEIDSNSGFCFGVVTAIRKAEEALGESTPLYCLGDIVHNAAEVERLEKKGLITITHEEMENLHDVKVLLRAHGEPPSTYEIARRNNIEIIDATCPVVLQLQRRIKDSASEEVSEGLLPPLILIYGKPGHAEVNGLVGQTGGEAIVIRDVSDLDAIDLSRDIRLYSQTTKSLDGFRCIVEEISERKKSLGGDFQWFDTICRQVANRMDKIRKFAGDHDVVIFVSGAKSSNGKVLFNECLKVNPRTYLIASPDELKGEWIEGASSIGICGATSTPAWLMEDVAARLNDM
ncbi:MAG: 4-hydroxy-3-methylbut-2-enyl diphosphate reductase [Muribaculaceae bacterium]|nr:4-hydroxy-3-methylbut-2-enyl diphosphate reductase [Muribaculaceae bacterium]